MSELRQTKLFLYKNILWLAGQSVIIQNRSGVKIYQEMNSLLASQTFNSSLTASWEQTTWKFLKSALKPSLCII